jgi:DNA-binding ferritin-like protein
MTYSGSPNDNEMIAANPAVRALGKPGAETAVREPDHAQEILPLVQCLVSLAALHNKLYTQSHLIHLNVEGSLFLPLHEFFKEQYLANIENFDKTAEFVRTLDYLMPMCEKGLGSACSNFVNIGSYNCKDMCNTYLNNIEAMGMVAKNVGELAREVKAPDVENFCAELVAHAFKSAWMLKATLR